MNSVLTKVDLPSPDSPVVFIRDKTIALVIRLIRTDYHDIEVEALANALAVPLVWQIRKTNISSELPADNVLHIIGRLGRNLRVFGGNSLRDRRAISSRGGPLGGRRRRWLGGYRGRTRRSNGCCAVGC